MLYEEFPGDRTSLCELLHAIAQLGDRDWLRDQWTSRVVETSFDELLSVVFDDLHIRDRAKMRDGYLGTYQGLPRDLGTLADALDEYDARMKQDPRRTDPDILEDLRWSRVAAAARAIADQAVPWRRANCDTRIATPHADFKTM